MELERRPHNLHDLEEQESLTPDKREASASIEPDSDEEIWIFNIPKTIDPKDLIDQTISTKKKRTIALNDKEYEAVKGKTPEEPIPCFYKNSEGELQMAFIRPEKSIQIVRKC